MYWYTKSAEQDNTESMYKIAKMHEYGRGIEKSIEEAFLWYEKSAKKGNTRAQNKLGWFYSKGINVTSQSENKIISEKTLVLAQQGDEKEQYKYGVMFAGGFGIKRNYKLSEEWFLKAAKKNYAPAQNSLGVLYATKKISPPLQEGQDKLPDYFISKEIWVDLAAVKWFKKSAEQGYAPAENNLGLMYGHNRISYYKNIKQDALVLLTKAAEKGDMVAQSNLGSVFTGGSSLMSKFVPYDLKISKYCSIITNGLKPDHYKNYSNFERNKNNSCYPLSGYSDFYKKISSKWNTKSAEQGYAPAQYVLSREFARKKNLKLSESWYIKASQKRDFKYQCFLAANYIYLGQGDPDNRDHELDKKMAFYWYQKSAELNDRVGQYNLADWYESSDLMDREASALYWYEKSAQQGYAKSQYKLAKLYIAENGRFGRDAEAVMWLKKAGRNGIAEAYTITGMAYLSGRGVAKSKFHATRYFLMAVKGGHLDAGKFLLPCILPIEVK